MIQIQPMSERSDDIELKLDEADMAAALSDTRLTHDEVFGKYRW